MKREFIPQDYLSKFMECHWELTSSKEKKVVLVPEGTFYLIYSTQEIQLSASKTHNLDSNLYLLPITDKIVTVKYKHDLSAIRFKAFALPFFLRKKNLINQVNLDYYTLNEEFFLIEKKSNKINTEFNSLPEHFNFLITDLFKDKNVDESLKNRINYILERKGVISINEMAAFFNISRQNLHKYFINNIKISPKKLASIWKMNNFINLSKQCKKTTISAIDSGYFDQSHSIKEFKKYFKKSPNSIINGDSKTLDSTYNSIQNRFTNGYKPK